MRENTLSDTFCGQIIKGIITGLTIALVGVLVFALVVSLASLSESVVKPVNQFIKLLAVFGGCAFSVKNEKGYLKGGIIGFAVTLLTFLIFGLIGGALGNFVVFLIDAVCGTVVGVLSGVISVNLPRRR